MAVLSDGTYRIHFTEEQQLTAPGDAPGAPLMLLPEGAADGGVQKWRVEGTKDGRYSIRTADSPLYVSFDGDPDMHESALLQPELREWQLTPGIEPDTFIIGVP